MCPFSFREFLRFKGAKPGENFEYITEERAKISKHIAQYIEDGGFPDCLDMGGRRYFTGSLAIYSSGAYL
jgi:hypothetical protein